MAINGRAAFLSYKYAAIQMIAQGKGGRIIGAGSVSSIKGIRRPGFLSKQENQSADGFELFF